MTNRYERRIYQANKCKICTFEPFEFAITYIIRIMFLQVWIEQMCDDM